MTFSKLGTDTQTGQDVLLYKTSRFQGLYVIGATGTGKSGLFENLIYEDSKQGIGFCVIDPHGQLIEHVIARLPAKREQDIVLLDIHDYRYPFGLNLFTCSDPSNPLAVQEVVDRVMHVFGKLLGVSTETPLILEYLRNCTYTLVANPRYTMAEIPLLLQDEQCRRKLLVQVTDPDVLLFWKRYERMKPSEQNEQAAAILRRVQEFLQPLTRPIVGQSASTINLQEIMDKGKMLLVKLNVLKLEQVSNFIGSLIIAQFLNSLSARTNLFNMYVDEFQRFSTKDFATLFAEARKFGIGLTVAHQFRNQLDTDNKGATLTAANMIVFRVSSTDADELAGQFNITPQAAWEEEIEKEWVEVLEEEWEEEIEKEWHERVEEVVEDGIEEIKEPVRDAISHLEKVGHSDRSVETFLKHWKLENYPAQFSQRRLLLDDELNRHLQLHGGVLAYLNEVFYTVMKERNLCHPLPLPLFEWAVRMLQLSFFNQTQYQEWALEEYQSFYHPHYNPRIHALQTEYKKRRVLALPYQPKDYCSFLLKEGVRDDPVSEDDKAVYARLWQAQDEKSLQNAFAEYEQLVRTKLYCSFTQAIKRYLSNAPFAAPASPDATLAEWYATLQIDVRSALWNGLSVEKDTGLREKLGLTDLVVPVHQLRWEKRYYEGYYSNTYNWYIVDGELERLDYEPFIKEQIEKIVAQQKPAFEAFVREFREVLQALAKDPITSGSGLQQPRKRTQIHYLTHPRKTITHPRQTITHPRKTIMHPQRTYADVLNEIANQIVGLPDYTARVKIKGDTEHIIQTLDPKKQADKPLYGQLLDDRVERIKLHSRTAGYTRPRQDVEAEIRMRQDALRQAQQPQVREVPQPQKTETSQPQTKRRYPVEPEPVQPIAASDSNLEQELHKLWKKAKDKGLTTLEFEKWCEQEAQQIDWLKKLMGEQS